MYQLKGLITTLDKSPIYCSHNIVVNPDKGTYTFSSLLLVTFNIFTSGIHLAAEIFKNPKHSCWDFRLLVTS